MNKNYIKRGRIQNPRNGLKSSYFPPTEKNMQDFNMDTTHETIKIVSVELIPGNRFKSYWRGTLQLIKYKVAGNDMIYEGIDFPTGETRGNSPVPGDTYTPGNTINARLSFVGLKQRWINYSDTFKKYMDDFDR